ncbi:MAG: hypothetical protein COV43_08985 [Deltaproteobacteria bacterium CG11_big_fil_rev_8_21_14_0_20_42_23]|nr:MAG: hypothetical protein COV43_08985 [Deltaproteobacteria bacterium CG11_big_fil_rev_8_21_14_0_20_42_23]PJC63412.1 MAG: hypothetical protein CO021_09595 [Deltaproteobacteria bacterium CG_4_9_14_0_2_um_filter_42_21]
MARGGKREGAGRKSGVGNLLTEELRSKIDPVPLIGFLQDLAEGRIEGASISERKEAAVALLRKVLPDCKSTSVHLDQDPGIVITYEQARDALEAYDEKGVSVEF